MDPFQNSFVAVAIQITGVLMVAAVVRPFARLVPDRGLNYWSAAWLVLAASLALLYVALRANRVHHPAYSLLIVGYCLTEYLFAFLVWAGIQELTTGEPVGLRHWAWFVPFVTVATGLPILLPEFGALFPVHAIFVGGLFLAAFITLYHAPVSDGGRSPGLWLMRLSVGGLVLLFWHYPVVTGLVGYFDPELLVPYMEFWKLYDLLLETGLAFGMVVLAAERVQIQLTDRNRQLAAATEELAKAARTDPLTGLFNRRALDDLADDLTARKTSGCLAVLDMNDLKPLNDRYGHAAGDAAIQVVARALRNLFRVTDPIYRTGGDEFLVVLVGGCPADLTSRLSKLDAGVVGRLPGCSDPVSLTVACGIAEFGEVADLWDAVQQADATMYRAKKKQKSGVIAPPAARTEPPAAG